MKRVLQCPTCLAKFNVDDAVAGKTVGCSKCNATFTARMFPFANIRMAVNLYCSETGKRLGTYHSAGEISVFE